VDIKRIRVRDRGQIMAKGKKEDVTMVSLSFDSLRKIYEDCSLAEGFDNSEGMVHLTFKDGQLSSAEMRYISTDVSILSVDL
jgi:hypothetical protein